MDGRFGRHGPVVGPGMVELETYTVPVCGGVSA